MPSNAKQATPGSPAPPFICKAVIDGTIKEVSLSDYTTSNHWLVLVFIPMAFSFVCPTELLAFAARHSEFIYHAACAVVFVSTDSEHALRAWNATPVASGGLGNVHLPLLSDRNHFVSSSYGVLDEEEGVARRATFLIDPKGMVRFSCVSDGMVGRSVEETKRVLDALQFADEHGQGCPSDWKKGQQGVKMDRWNFIAPKAAKLAPLRLSQLISIQPPAALDKGNVSPTQTTMPKFEDPDPKPRRPQTLRRMHTSPVGSREDANAPIRDLDRQAIMRSMDEVIPPPPEYQMQAYLQKRESISVDHFERSGSSTSGSTRSSWASGGWASVLNSPAGRKLSVISQASVKGFGARRESIAE